MTGKERHPLSEVTSENVYAKAREILDLHGHHGTRSIFYVILRPDSGRPRITGGEDIPITEAPIVPIQIADNEYRLWLRSKDDKPSDIHNGAIQLNVYFQRLPYGPSRIEYDSEGHETAHWYKPTDEPELRHVEAPRSSDYPGGVPKELLELSWYMAKDYSIEPNSNSSSNVEMHVPPNIAEGLGDGNNSLLTILEKMQTELEGKSI